MPIDLSNADNYVDVDASSADGASVDLSGPISLDLSEISDSPVAEGWHTVTIERAEAKLSSEKQLPMIFVMARVTDEADPEHNRTVVWNLMLKGEGLRFLKRCLGALGLGEQLDYPSYQAMADDLVGRSCDAKVKHRQYRGETQANVNSWRELTEGIEL